MVKRFIQKLLFFCIALYSIVGFGQQNSKPSFWKPADSLHTRRLTYVVAGEVIAITGAFIGLNQLWYADYPKSDFHLLNDNKEWLQMDKVGHGYSAYHLSRVAAGLLDWSGVSHNKQLIYGAGLGLVLESTIEVFDGYSAEWGASTGDIIANTAGTATFVIQELLWQEQRIQPKYSFHQTSYASIRPNTLGKSITEQMLKDYNGQTYWLSCNLNSLTQYDKIPTWLNLALGYGAEGMLTGDLVGVNNLFYSPEARSRQFYLSLDLDLTKIKTKNQLLKTFFNNLNMIKIPAPTLEIRGNGRVTWHALYF